MTGLAVKLCELSTDVWAGLFSHGISNAIKLKSRQKKNYNNKRCKNNTLPVCSVSFGWAPYLRNPEGVNSYLKGEVKNLKRKNASTF